MTYEKALEKAKAIVDDQPIPEAIQIYQAIGNHIEARIEASKKEVELQMKALRGDE